MSKFSVADCYPNMLEIIDRAKDVGLKVWLNFWAYGGVFGGEAYSGFLHHNHRYRQITAESKEAVPSACINSEVFRTYFHNEVRKIIKDSHIDGIFLDEPHYYPLFSKSEFTCICEECQEAYEKMHSEKMPMEYTDQIETFREESMFRFLSDTCGLVKSSKKTTEVCVCVLPVEGPMFGTIDWERIASMPNVDMFSTDPYYHVFGKSKKWALEVAKKAIRVAKKYEKKSQLWLQLFRLPRGQEKAVSALIPEFNELGVDSLFGWSYLANKGTHIASDEPELLWKYVTEQFVSLGE
ncbi:MAG: hypothetical protein GF411_09505 [Candidatus Lokiarchaeota archaeon]|nr:hypothetical protein [Candidatus Lokiarchaeota archaeon]